MSLPAGLDPGPLREIERLEDFQAGACAEVARLFAVSLARDLERVGGALASDVAAALAAALHSIKGCAAGVGARELAARAAALESRARAGEAASLAPQVDDLGAAAAEAIAALRHWSSGIGAARDAQV